jgi:2-amino-4-hydroxy-6-hydroxymethyldihydropteridine diphosphokinase
VILIALGSNVGDRASLLAQARACMQVLGMHVILASRLYETPALLPEDAPDAWDVPFLNQVVAVESALAPEAMLGALKALETKLGRQDRGRWGPREIDLDLLAHGDALLELPALQLPHPRLHERRFVLEPLVEIAPGWRHPRLQKTAATLLAELV